MTPPTTIDSWLRTVSDTLADAMIPSARLDAEIILTHTINKPRTWMHAHGDEYIDPRRKDIADARAELRLERVPVAYIIGHKYFYGRRFYVTPDTLIPRPESEVLIDLIKAYVRRYPAARQLVDIGTGSGCLGVTAKLECPKLHVTLADTSAKALSVASKNADMYNVETRIVKSDLLAHYPLKADIIVANLPYVDREWTTAPELQYEPEQALYADDRGLALIHRCIIESLQALSSTGILILEADERQHQAIIDDATRHGYVHRETQGLGLVFSVAP